MKMLLAFCLLNAFLFAETFSAEDFNGLSSQEKISAVKRITSYKRLINTLRKPTFTTSQKLISVNRFFNTYKYVSDKKLYGKKDFWSTRKNFVILGKGDCEDFAVAKYKTLLEVGVDYKKLSLLFANYKKQKHIVLVYKTSKADFYLDNNTDKISSNKGYIEPLYSLDAKENISPKNYKDYLGNKFYKALNN